MFLTCGDALYDVFTSSVPDLATRQLTARVGGSPLNVALGLARLGNDTGFLTANSTDPMGQQIQQFLTDNGVQTQFMASTARPTSLAMVATDVHGVPDYRFYLDGSADVSLAPAQLPQQTQWTAISLGSYSTVVEPCASTLQGFVAACAPHSVIAYDPNIRPSIEPRVSVWLETIKALGQHADLIKLSDEDAAFLAPDQSADEYARSLLGFGARWVLLTRGGDGVSIFSADGEVEHVPGRQVSVVDTVGAGDTFQAGLLHALNQQGSLSKVAIGQANMRQAAEFAIKAAAITCTRQGADLPTLAEVEAE